MRRVHFLLVEDDPDQAQRIRHAVAEQSGGHRVTEFGDGSSALEYLQEKGEDARERLPDLILLDLDLPGRHGLDVLREIKEAPALRAIPVVVLTSSRSQEDISRAYDRFVNSYLLKPVEYGQLAELIETITTYWGELNQSVSVADSLESRRSP